MREAHYTEWRQGSTFTFVKTICGIHSANVVEIRSKDKLSVMASYWGIMPCQVCMKFVDLILLNNTELQEINMREILAWGLLIVLGYGVFYGFTLPDGTHYKFDMSEEKGVTFTVDKKK